MPRNLPSLSTAIVWEKPKLVQIFMMAESNILAFCSLVGLATLGNHKSYHFATIDEIMLVAFIVKLSAGCIDVHMKYSDMILNVEGIDKIPHRSLCNTGKGTTCVAFCQLFIDFEKVRPKANASICSESIQMTTNMVRVKCNTYNVPQRDWNDLQSKASIILVGYVF